MTHEYEVVWSMVLQANDEIDAVTQAIDMLQDPQNTATFLRVTDINTGKTSIRDYESLWQGELT